MAEKWPKTEADLAAVVVDYLADAGWEIYQEVEGPRGRADIVAVRGPLVQVVEVKKTLGLDLLAQGDAWRPWAHLVSLAFPRPAKFGGSRSRDLAIDIAKERGLGLIQVREPDAYHETIKQLASPRLNRRPIRDLRDRLTEDHKTYAKAGNAEGKYWSPFKNTCRELAAFVAEHPGVTLRAAVAGIGHHYSSAASAIGSLRGLIESGVVEGVELRTDAKPWRLVPAGWSGPMPRGEPTSVQAPLFGSDA